MGVVDMAPAPELARDAVAGSHDLVEERYRLLAFQGASVDPIQHILDRSETACRAFPHISPCRPD
jgi:hypothetical protein